MWKTKYPKRYYVHYRDDDDDIKPIKGWYDMSLYSRLDNMPEPLEAITEEQWNHHKQNYQTKCILDGNKIVPYNFDEEHYGLNDEAKLALALAKQYVIEEFISMAEVPTQEWVEYQKALKAIIDGTDPTSTELPKRPS